MKIVANKSLQKDFQNLGVLIGKTITQVQKENKPMEVINNVNSDKGIGKSSF